VANANGVILDVRLFAEARKEGLKVYGARRAPA
jgi:hypothetical protein